jgi:hypothetical protein
MNAQEPGSRAAAEPEWQAGPPRPDPPPSGAAQPGPPQADPPRAQARLAAAGQPAGPVIRASDRDRDGAAQRIQEAFADGRLDDEEFDDRMRAVLTARTTGDLDRLTADVPAPAARGGTGVAGGSPGRWAVAYKNSIRRGGRWRVPERFQALVYKGSGWLDLRAAELTAPVTTVLALAYKSRIDILVPPGVRVEMEGFGVSKGWSDAENLERLAPRDAPVVQVRGIAYKGSVEVRTRPADQDG